MKTTQINKKRRSTTLLLTNYGQLIENDVLSGIDEIRHRLIIIFKNHIGIEKSISAFELFEAVYGIEPTALDIFKREYWWKVVKNVLRQLRSEEKLFVINKGRKLFVLKSEEELSYYCKTVNRSVKDLLNMKKKAKRWYNKRAWKHIK